MSSRLKEAFGCRVGGGRAGCPSSVRSIKRPVQFSRRPLSFAVLSLESSLNQIRDKIHPFSALRCPWIAPFHGILGTSVGSFSHGTIQLSHTYSPLPGTFHSQQSTGPSPSAVPFEHLSAAALGNDPSPFALSLFMSTIPRSESWHRFGRNFAFRLYPHLPHGSSRSMFVFPVSRPFVCGCHNISTILPLGQYQASLGHTRLFPTVSPANTLVRWRGTQTPSPP